MNKTPIANLIDVNIKPETNTEENKMNQTDDISMTALKKIADDYEKERKNIESAHRMTK